MLLISLRDLQMRRRRFVVAVLAVGLVFGITLLLDGFKHSLTNEVTRTVKSFGGDSWLVPSGSSGPFTPDHLAPEDITTPLQREGSQATIEPIIALGSTVHSGTRIVNVNVVGTNRAPKLSAGRWPRTDDEIVANDDLDIGIGSRVTVSKHPFRVVGQTAHLRYFAGTNAMFLRLHSAQGLFVFGQRLATGFVVHGKLSGPLPSNLTVMSNDAVVASLRRPIKVASSSIAFLDVLLWIVAAGIIGTILYMTSLERLRDFAALKAIGAKNRHLFVTIAVQAVILSIASALVAWVAARVLQPIFPITVEIPRSSYPLTLAVAVLVGLIGSGAGVRRAMATDPALAFGG